VFVYMKKQLNRVSSKVPFIKKVVGDQKYGSDSKEYNPPQPRAEHGEICNTFSTKRDWQRFVASKVNAQRIKISTNAELTISRCSI
jgi:hypothetical protein